MHPLHTSSATTLSKGLPTGVVPGRSDHTSAKRNGDRDLSRSPSESVRLRYFLLGALFMQLANVLLNLWLDAAVMP